MPANQSLGVRDNCKIETAIREIDVAVGTVVLTRLPATSEVEGSADPRPETITLVGPETKTFDPAQSGFDVYALEGARFHLTYETDPVGTEEARDKGPKKRRRSISSEPQPRPVRRQRSTARKEAPTKTSGEPARGKASASGQRNSSRASKSASSSSGARSKSSTSSKRKRS